MKLQGSRSSDRKILQSQISLNGKNRLQVNRLAVVHGRLITPANRLAAWMLASNPASILNQNQTDLGNPNRFTDDSDSSA